MVKGYPSSDYNYLSSPDDVYVLNLRQTVQVKDWNAIRGEFAAKTRGKVFPINFSDRINGRDPGYVGECFFEHLPIP